MWLDGRVLKGFRDFVLRGNVVDLAVAVVIGAAFTAVVNAFAADFLTPLIGLAGGGGRLGGVLTVHGQPFRWGAFLSQLITFLLTAAVVYFLVVLPMHALLERRRRGQEKGPVLPTQIELLVEIRDLLRAQQVGAAAHAAAPQRTPGAPPAPGRQLPPVPPRRDG
jgi:large conductance mechanosensitive channel